MRILQLFISDILDIPINWVLIEEDGVQERGTSDWDDLHSIEGVHIEVYLNACCCSIQTINVAGITNKRLSEELILGMLEESIADDIEEVAAVVLRTEDDIAYVAVFNKLFYDSLILYLINLDKPIRFLQSFVYLTHFEENEWTLFISDEQQFLRTSKYEYCLIDDNRPLPYVFTSLFASEKPSKLRVYGDCHDLAKLIAEKYSIPFEVDSRLNFGILVWNFYNQKSTQFNIKLDVNSKKDLYNLWKIFRTFAFVMVILWLSNVLITSCSIRNSKSVLEKGLSDISPTNKFDIQALQAANSKVSLLRHQKGLYSNNDAVPLLNSFLAVVSSVGTDSILQTSYNNGILKIFLTKNFNTAQFSSYQNILATSHIKASIEDYKSYLRAQKENQTNDNPDMSSASEPVDASWVVTIETLLAQDKREGSN